VTDTCEKQKTPWAAPGQAPNLGGGCGIQGGNPYGCPAGDDTRDPNRYQPCGQPGSANPAFLGTTAFGTDARKIPAPDAITTNWKLGSKQTVAWTAGGGHWGGYTYRLCKLPAEGRTGITEECFAKNILKFADSKTRWRLVESPDDGWSTLDRAGTEDDDITEGTNPPGSAWRPVGKKTVGGGSGRWTRGTIRKDKVMVPTDLPTGDYVLSFRWDTEVPQVWVSCANVKLVK